jgi:hypothetical protein
VTEKHRSNFCEYFDFVLRDWSGEGVVNSRGEEARDALKKLFGD